MDANYMGALKAFLSHNPREMPIDPGAADPLRDRGPDAVVSPARGAASKPSGPVPAGADLLPLIFAQLALEKSNKVKVPSRDAVRSDLFSYGYNDNPGIVDEPNIFRNAPGPGGAGVFPIPESGRPPAGAFQRDPADMAAQLDWMLKERQRRMIQRLLNAPDPLYVPPELIPRGFEMYGVRGEGKRP